MATALQQPARPVGPQTQQPVFDFQQLMQMILAAQTQQQGAAIDAATKPRGAIASSERNMKDGRGRSLGLAGWYEMNPHAMPGESYDSSRNAQVRNIGQTRAMQDVTARTGMAAALLNLQKLQDQMFGGNLPLGFSPNMTNRYNPFAGM